MKKVTYDHKKIEQKWQKKWARTKLYKTREDKGKKKFYVLDMFPYPSGEGLHVGHPKGYFATDVISRYHRMKGESVLHPMGFDAFGLPAENYALKTKTHPAIAVKANIDRYKSQLQILGFDYDWSREVDTTDPKYYKWTQWIFLQLWKKGLAYESYEPINWCPVDKTGLANEDVENGRCERCGTLVEKRPMRQWVLKITDYAERLLRDLDAIDESGLPHIIDLQNPPKANKKQIKRHTAHAIVIDPKTNKYLAFKWKKHPWTTIVIGGVEDGEDMVEAARREVLEETGYSDIKFIKTLGDPVVAEYYAAHKDQNRVAVTTGLVFELSSDKRVEISKEEKDAHDIVWLDIDNMANDINPCAELPFWLARFDPDKELTFIDRTTDSAVREDQPFMERNAITAIVKHWSEDKYIGLKWKTADWKTLITGAPENGQSPEEGAIKEIIEETGYMNPKLVKKMGKVHSKFFHIPKKVNRFAHFDVFYFELENGKQQEITKDDKDNHDVVWLSKNEMMNFLTPEAHRYIWAKFFGGVTSNEVSPPKLLLDWPSSIKEAQRNWIGRSEGAEIDFRIELTKNRPRFVLIHGFQGSAKTNFFPWLKKELENRGHEVEVPELPNPDYPKEDEQVDYVIKNCHFDENTVVIGHSLGAIVAMKVLMKLNKPVSGLVVVAAAIDPKFYEETDSRTYSREFKWDFDYSLIQKLTSGRIAVLSDLKEKERMTYLKYLAGQLNAKLIETESKDEHFCALEEPEVLRSVTPVVKVFTTRPDTLFGVTYLVLAPEHGWVGGLLSHIENRTEVEAYINRAKGETEIQRTDQKREKTGVELKGVRAINPANNKEVPIWIADYVLPDYGTGAVMAVPAHDERDFKFAQKFNLPVHLVVREYPETRVLFVIRGIVSDWKQVLNNYNWEMREDWGVYVSVKEEQIKDFITLAQTLLKDGPYYASTHGSNRYIIYKSKYFDIYIPGENEKAKSFGRELKIPENELDWTEVILGNGILIDSGKFTGKDSESVIKEITSSVGGKWVTNYKLRDWVFSRQRYWGEPIPLIHCEKCGVVPVPEKDLPLKLPDVKSYEPTTTGESPLAAISKWVNVKCPQCKGPAKRETNTMPQWAGSSWYYLRYEDPKNKKALVDKNKEKYWSPVDLYVGGAEHATRHLIYARFWHKFLYDIGIVSSIEPFKKLQNVGLIMGEDGRKMSKRDGNVVNPDDIVATYGADTLRIYEMFMGPFDQEIKWDTSSIIGSRRLVEGVWKLGDKITGLSAEARPKGDAKVEGRTSDSGGKLADKILHKVIKKVTADIESMRFNTAISSLMIAVNELSKMDSLSKKQYTILLQLFAPFAPHVVEELWKSVGNKGSIHKSIWPVWDPTLIVDDEVNIVVQVNGKHRASFMTGIDTPREKLENMAQTLPEIKKWLDDLDVKKVIVVPNRLVNIVGIVKSTLTRV